MCLLPYEARRMIAYLGRNPNIKDVFAEMCFHTIRRIVRNTRSLSSVRSSYCLTRCNTIWRCGVSVVFILLSTDLSLAQDSTDSIRSPIPINFQHATSLHQITVRGDAGETLIHSTGRDPFLWIELPGLKAHQRDWVFAFEYFCPQGIKEMQWRSGRPATATHFVRLPALAPAEGWTRYSFPLSLLNLNQARFASELPVRIDWGNHQDVQLRIRNVEIRPMTDVERRREEVAESERARKEKLSKSLRDYWQRDWPATIERFMRENGRIVVSGRVASERWQGSKRPAKWFAIPRAHHAIAANPPTAEELAEKQPIVIDATGAFRLGPLNTTASLWNLTAGRVQLLQLSEDDSDDLPKLVSAAHYVAIGNRQPPASSSRRTDFKKGLTCITTRFQADELRELGIEHGSVNLPLVDLVSPTPKPGFQETNVGGATWYINEGRLRHYDRNIRLANRAGAQVAGILLIPNGPPQRSPLIHPESDLAGIYSMPNLTERDAAAAYDATLQVLAKRYSGSDGNPDADPLLRVDHWIVHNEIDYGWQWTNMGEQPIEVFLEHYIRSMRMVDSAMREHNQNARVFISLTHRWNTRDNQHWRTYAPRELVELLIESNALEGDFPWGVAYHPYPQSLWKADTWNDSNVTNDNDTPLITMKNLAVLDRFMHSPRCRNADGSLRPVILSEQGFHADENNPEQLETQNAALLYTWQKIRECQSVLAFDYHRPTDHPDEGGLRLGLRGLPSTEHPKGAPKPAWEIFRALGTPAETDYLRRYERFWSDN